MKLILFFLTFTVILFADSRFIRDAQNGIVKDSRYNLIWQDSYGSSSEIKKLEWQDAINYCENLQLAGYEDWRLPNFNELYYLANRNYYSPSIDKVFENIEIDFYWTSTTYVKDKTIAWLVNFNSGDDGWDSKKNNKYFIRCVRDAN